ncbi:hypothetical protein DERP_014159 [Dermatophagoides pteronyssinus]|nr:hypothetical protein DERP_014159 [Dermatophagoides pteronyssinus]
MSIRGNIKKILFPHIVKHINISLCGASIFFIAYLMFDLISTLINEIQNGQSPDDKLSMKTGKVLYYFRNFFLLMLLALIQLFGMVGALKQNRNILTTFICCLMVSFVIMMIDYLTTDNGYLALGIFFLIQSLFAYLLIWLNQYRGRQISNIHYIPMPPDDELHGQRHSSFSSDSMRF